MSCAGTTRPEPSLTLAVPARAESPVMRRELGREACGGWRLVCTCRRLLRASCPGSLRTASGGLLSGSTQLLFSQFPFRLRLSGAHLRPESSPEQRASLPGARAAQGGGLWVCGTRSPSSSLACSGCLPWMGCGSSCPQPPRFVSREAGRRGAGALFCWG